MSDDADNVDRELFRNVEKLRQLRIEHRDLDEVIARLSMDIYTTEMQLRRHKKPDLIAEVIAMLITVLIALVAARLARAWDTRRGASRELGLHARVTEGIVMLPPYLVALIVKLI